MEASSLPAKPSVASVGPVRGFFFKGFLNPVSFKGFSKLLRKRNVLSFAASSDVFFYLSIFKNWFQCEVFKVLSRTASHPAWRLRDSNSRPPACKAGALPTELSPRKLGSHLLSHAVSSIVPSAASGLTIVFGMGTGVSRKRIAT